MSIWALSACTLVCGACNQGGGAKPIDAGRAIPDSGNRIVDVDLHSCPAPDDDPSGKILDVEYLSAHPGEAQMLSVWLREPRWAPVPACGSAGPDDRSATCPERDASLDARSALNAQEFNCVLADGFNLKDALFVSKAKANTLYPVYWEDPYHFTDGRPLAILVSFQSGMTWALAQQLARHPYVARLESPPGQVPFLGVQAPPPPTDCPTAHDTALPKLSGALGLEGAGRKGVVITMKTDNLPPQAGCGAIDASAAVPFGCPLLCNGWTYTEWERYLLNRRAVTCVERDLDSVVGSGEYPVSFSGVVGSQCTPPIPPFSFGVTPTVLVEFGRALTWEEAQKVAAHPYVESIRQQDFGDGGSSNGCPLNTDAAIPMSVCTIAHESTTGKWLPSDQVRWQASPGPNDVVITVRGGGQVCPAPKCPPAPNPCPELDLEQQYLEEWNWESQSCVRDLIQQLGGQATDERFWLVDIIDASLTWPQIQAVAALPDVQSIESATASPADGGAPP